MVLHKLSKKMGKHKYGANTGVNMGIPVALGGNHAKDGSSGSIQYSSSIKVSTGIFGPFSL